MDASQLTEIYQQMQYPTSAEQIDEATRRNFHIPVKGDEVAYWETTVVDFAEGKYRYWVDGVERDHPPDNLRVIAELEANIFAAIAMTPDSMLEKLIMERKTVAKMSEELGIDTQDIEFRLLIYYGCETNEES